MSENGSLQRASRDIERLDDVHERVSRIEGRMEGLATKAEIAQIQGKDFATKEDVANAKVSMITMWVTLAVIVGMAVVNALIRFLL